MSISRKHNVKVIEDSCHAPLSEYRGKKLGTFGIVSCFSFFSNKNISTGEGGMYVTKNKAFYEKAKLYRSHGMTSNSYDRSTKSSVNYDVLELGFNYRIDDIRASIALVQLTKLSRDIVKREKIRQWYIKYLKDVKGVVVPFSHCDGKYSNYIFSILVNDRDEVRAYLEKMGIQTSIHYQPVHRFEIYKKYYSSLPVTDDVTSRLLTLPMYSSLKEVEIKYITKCLKNIVK